MNAASFLELSTLIDGVNRRLEDAVDRWRRGTVGDEPALIERVGDHFGHPEWECDAGADTSRPISTKMYSLHRKGEGAADHHGSDLGFTLYADDVEFLKTALFQLKLADDGIVKIERSQLERATRSKLVKRRTFTAAYDDKTGEWYVASAADLLEKVTKSTKQFNCREWTPLNDWLVKWLTSRIGPMSPIGSSHSIEAYLEKFKKNTSGRKERVPWLKAVDSPESLPLPREWIQINATK